jgi:lipid-A-disaccharide synthase
MSVSDFSPPKAESVDLLVIAGEASGDEHASILIEELLKDNPNVNVSALGGKCLQAKGAHLIYPLVDHAVVGLFEVLKNYFLFKNIFLETLKWIQHYKPHTILLVDYPGFNLRLARELRKNGISVKGGGSVKLLQYISPQLWAWKPKRRFMMEEVLDGLAVLFPFEVECYRDTKLPVSFVGHPFGSEKYEPTVCYEPNSPLLILPGSRIQPVERILPVFLDAYEQLLHVFSDMDAYLPVPDKNIRSVVEKILMNRPELKKKVKVVPGSKKIKVRAALMSSGTMSLSCAVAGIPGVIGYRAHPITYLLGRLLVKVPHLGMANLLLSSNPPYPEFLQSSANGKNLKESMEGILNDHEARAKAEANSSKIIQSLRGPKEKNAKEWLNQGISRC